MELKLHIHVCRRFLDPSAASGRRAFGPTQSSRHNICSLTRPLIEKRSVCARLVWEAHLDSSSWHTRSGGSSDLTLMLPIRFSDRPAAPSPLVPPGTPPQPAPLGQRPPGALLGSLQWPTV